MSADELQDYIETQDEIVIEFLRQRRKQEQEKQEAGEKQWTSNSASKTC
jgi:hypothetical protein